MKRPEKKVKKGAPAWMTTFSDMMTLILVFFILLFSMSQIDAARFEAVAESFRNRMIFTGFPSNLDMQNPTENSNPNQNQEGATDFKNNLFDQDVDDLDESTEDNKEELDELLQEVEGYLEENNLQDVISANRTDQGVVLILQERVLFETAEANVKSEGEPFLDKVGLLLTNIPNEVRVEGHTDNRPISTTVYPSNWELSGARASSVIRFILEQHNLDQERFIAVGYGDTRPIAPNDSVENWRRNRRVEIVILEIGQELTSE
ncbi:hypothetical protein GCM10012290_18460 [Halolactibacillus alkaliphilus]|uniref:OmpA-like domain-containing protein n=1 Tax=Halolactibacillus alkaliphilus TaxID=442899 RepID=A0A511X2W0_9BACI|nr:flagellar motor protein MotS [Halolactibacillus alkaliphilus]GEN57286.1 hypothetical protein HAL01_17500 [Halolactibacillus alkaliphilus]GGN72459.1 hypothetical protein GCM10012290_18460 [Halolactibacillus alkaliphilus]SFO89667.1 chemotaxis protein MotB [Halolactibacillus alkaliphilus]